MPPNFPMAAAPSMDARSLMPRAAGPGKLPRAVSWGENSSQHAGPSPPPRAPSPPPRPSIFARARRASAVGRWAFRARAQIALVGLCALILAGGAVVALHGSAWHSGAAPTAAPAGAVALQQRLRDLRGRAAFASSLKAAGGHPLVLPEGGSVVGLAGPSELPIAPIAHDRMRRVRVAAESARARLLAPLLQMLVYIGGFVAVLVALDRLFHVAIVAWAAARKALGGGAPEERFHFQRLPDQEAHGDVYPTVVVQLPMFNERACSEQAIDAACELHWPARRLLVQVLDDSTDELTRVMIEDKVHEWKEKGLNIELRHRTSRSGFKAGAMKDAQEFIAGYEFCAVFDADFLPQPDFLHRVIPYLTGNPEIGFAQARWTFGNADESLLTKVQEISLNYHVKCEQYAKSSIGSFFNFNGTAGVWRQACVHDAGGWNARTTVEDMDLSLRAYLRGWRGLFLPEVTCLNELPASLQAYRKQQYRWSCGPMQLWRQAMVAVWQSDISWWQKLYLNLVFFGTRMFASQILALCFYCTIIPLAVVTPEVEVPAVAVFYLPAALTLTTALFTPRSWYHCITYVLFENAMSMLKVLALIAGLRNTEASHQWVVTAKHGMQPAPPEKPGKSGDAPAKSRPLLMHTNSGNLSVPKAPVRVWYYRELAMSAFVLGAAAYGSVALSRYLACAFLALQGIAFALLGLDLAGNLCCKPSYKALYSHRVCGSCLPKVWSL